MNPSPLPAKILCVDDDPITRAMYRMVLSRAGYSCEFARDGRSALSAVQMAPEKFVLVITDIEMPGLDGWTLARQLVAISFPGKILVISASSAISRENCPTDFAVDQIHPKPVSAIRLLSAVKELIGDSRGGL